MAEEKEKEPQKDLEDDPLADLLFEEEEGKDPPINGENSSEQAEPSQKEEKGQRASEETREEEASETSKEEPPEEPPEEPQSAPKEEKPPPPSEENDDPLASILGEEEISEEESENLEDQEEEEEQEETPEEPAPRKGLMGFLLIILAISVPLFLLGAGLATLWYLYQHPSFSTSQVEAKPSASSQNPSSKSSVSAPLAVSPIAVEDRKILFLRNFLIPYRRETGEFVFVKAKILLYYANSKEYEIAKKNETILREEIYRLFKNAPLYVWETERGAEVLQREIKEYLTKKKIGGVVPVDLQITGYILK